MKKVIISFGIICLILLSTLLYFEFKTMCSIPKIEDRIAYVDMYIAEQFVRLDLENTSSLIEMNSLNCENELEIRLATDTPYHVIFDGIPLVFGNSISYKLERLAPDYLIPITVLDQQDNLVKDYLVNTWNSSIPNYSFVGGSTYEGDYYMTMVTGITNLAIKVDNDGDLLYYYLNPTPNSSVTDFKKVETKDGIRYLLFATTQSKYDTLSASKLGNYIVMDEHYREIKRLSMKKSNVISEDGYPVDQHDCLYISDDEYYLITYKDENVYNIPDGIPHKKNGTLVTAAVIQGFRQSEMIFEWTSTDYPEFYGMSVDYNDFMNNTGTYSADYMHANSIDIDSTDGNLIISFRNIDSVIKLNKDDGRIMWILGGLGDNFSLTEDQKPSRQHYATYTDIGSILVFDNGNANQQSRIVEYWLDEHSRSITDFRSYQIDGYFSMFTGSVQRLDNERDVYMIGWGIRTAGDANGLYPQFSEIDFTNNKTLAEFRFFNSDISCYRCVKCK